MFGLFRRASGAKPGTAAFIIAAAALCCAAGVDAATGAADELRLERIGHRLAAANAGLCARPEMMTGLTLHDAGAYAPGARARLGLANGFGILRLLPGSTAERAGLRDGDEIVALDGSDLAGFAPELIAARASPSRGERFAERLSATLRAGPARLAVRRGAALLTVTLEGERGCGGSVLAVPGRQVNAWADGRYVAVTAHMLRYAADDRELAFVVAHEMAHNILGHTAPGASVRGRAAEEEADTLAVELLARAGMDLAAPERFLRRSARLQGLSLNLGHPGNRRRIAIVNAAIARIEQSNLTAACAFDHAARSETAAACATGGDAISAGAAPPNGNG